MKLYVEIGTKVYFQLRILILIVDTNSSAKKSCDQCQHLTRSGNKFVNIFEFIRRFLARAIKSISCLPYLVEKFITNFEASRWELKVFLFSVKFCGSWKIESLMRAAGANILVKLKKMKKFLWIFYGGKSSELMAEWRVKTFKYLLKLSVWYNCDEIWMWIAFFE